MPNNSDRDKTIIFFDYAKRMMKQSRMTEDLQITPDNIYQVAHKKNRDLLFEIMKIGHLPGSTLLGTENLIQLNQLAKEGKSCLILSEHLSNMDVPSLFTRCYDHENPLLKEIFEDFIFIAGTKLNQNQLVKLYTEMFTRIVIYAIRSLKKIENNEETELAKKINIRSIRKIKELRNQGYIFVLFPAGTRYRSWKPETKKGWTFTASYINSFDYCCCCSINGNNMPPRQHEDMTREPFLQDVITFNFGKVRQTSDLINEALTQNPAPESGHPDDKENQKQIIVDYAMEKINELHIEAEEYRKQHC